MMNIFHLMQQPGSSTIQALGGLHRMCGWARPIVTDSGGFQAYSLIHQNPKFGTLTDHGMIFQPEGSERKFQLTPEKSVQLQMSYGADVVICLDDCTHVDDRAAAQEDVGAAHDRLGAALQGGVRAQLVSKRGIDAETRPLLFAVIQGGGRPRPAQALRRRLLEIGFDGYGYGGWPLDAQGKLLVDIIAYTRELVPPQFPMHALGVGPPATASWQCARMGYDCSTAPCPRAMRATGGCYVCRGAGDAARCEAEWYSHLYIGDDKHIRASAISPDAIAWPVRSYSLAYLHHLFEVERQPYYRLATMHNLRFMTRLMERLREIRRCCRLHRTARHG